MKTERRHELQTNQLANWIGHQVEQVRPHLKVILGISVLGAAIIIGYFVYAKDRQSTLQMAWGDYYLALGTRDRDALDIVAKNHSGTIVELCARQSQADLDLGNGIAALYTNRDDAYRSLNDAKKSYSDVVESSQATPELLQHSLFGLGQVHEASSNLEKAKDYYSKVASQFPGTPVATEADARLKDLENPQIEKWYNWFGRQQPKAADPHSGLFNKQGFPGDLTKLPEKPDFPVSPVIPPTTTSPDSAPPDSAPPDSAPPESAPPVKPGDPKSDSKPEEGKAATDDKKPDGTKSETETKTEASKSEPPAAEKPAPEKAAPEKSAPEKSASENSAPEKTDGAKPDETKDKDNSTSPPPADKDAGPPPGT